MIEVVLQDLVSTAYGACTPEDGCPRAEIEAAEERLGFALPDALRDYYAVAGRHPELTGTAGREHTLWLSAPGRLDVEAGSLIFCGENRWPAQWSVSPGDHGWPDPRVLGRSGPGERWYSEFRRLSAFLVNLACRQAVRSLPHQAACRLRKGDLEVVEALLGYVGSRDVCKGGGWLSFADRSDRVLADYCRNTSTLRVGTAVPGALDSFRERSGLRLGPV
ncbi:SMI1/KNR4 family protein [Planomonospora sp. ID82291]|uniref:SMI1/KNR4 family protein n=1 Tax=Planomonospora sp. ID82291 TaxID=2738136 RepID=UPI0018C4256D|nr:SMI1/KNR4 family protein [Planomonospora sp. ID82291]MBG0817134.1 SMI1/KNR4 family protein [Planomonospora sp. ID82291]